MKSLADYRKDPEFRALEAEIVETQAKLDGLMQRLRDFFPLEGMRMWQVMGRGDRLCLAALTVSVPESENED